MILNSFQQQTMKKLKPEEEAFIKKLKIYYSEKKLSEKYYHIFLTFFDCFRSSLTDSPLDYVKNFHIFLELFLENSTTPYTFPLYHQKIRAPFDYYTFGKDFFKPLVDEEHCKLLGLDRLKEIETYLKNKENVILFANHQAELDPQAISMLLEEKFPYLADKVISVAGERVTTDPIAIPFSLGCDLLSIYSKKYIDNPPEHKHEKQLHNKKTMEVMQSLLEEGSKIIYVAPSGGRDRKGAEGKVVPSPFDPKSIEMFYLMAKKAKTPTHFYPLALATYDLLPPPEVTEKEIGEARSTQKAPISLSVGKEVDMESFNHIKDKHKKREERTSFIFNQMLTEYKKISN